MARRSLVGVTDGELSRIRRGTLLPAVGLLCDGAAFSVALYGASVDGFRWQRPRVTVLGRVAGHASSHIFAPGGVYGQGDLPVRWMGPPVHVHKLASLRGCSFIGCRLLIGDLLLIGDWLLISSRLLISSWLLIGALLLLSFALANLLVDLALELSDPLKHSCAAELVRLGEVDPMLRIVETALPAGYRIPYPPESIRHRTHNIRRHGVN